MVVEYSITFTGNGISVTQRVEPCSSSGAYSQAAVPAHSGKILSASFAESQVSAPMGIGGGIVDNPGGPRGAGIVDNPGGPKGGGIVDNPGGPRGAVTVVFGPIIVGCPPAPPNGSSAPPLLSSAPDQPPPAKKKTPAKKKAAAKKNA